LGHHVKPNAVTNRPLQLNRILGVKNQRNLFIRYFYRICDSHEEQTGIRAPGPTWERIPFPRRGAEETPDPDPAAGGAAGAGAAGADDGSLAIAAPNPAIPFGFVGLVAAAVAKPLPTSVFSISTLLVAATHDSTYPKTLLVG